MGDVTLETVAKHIIKELKDSKKPPSPTLLSFGIWMHTNLTDEEILFLEDINDQTGSAWLAATLLESGFYTFSRGHLVLK